MLSAANAIGIGAAGEDRFRWCDLHVEHIARSEFLMSILRFGSLPEFNDTREHV